MHKDPSPYDSESEDPAQYAAQIREKYGVEIRILQEASDAVPLNGITPNDHADGDGPNQRNAQIRSGGAEETGHTNQRAANTAQKDRTDQRQIMGIVLSHGVAYHVVEDAHTLFHQYLLAIGPFL